jgi:poly-gamma-glutamate synthesis protein (capsule biosynthesis protein)
MNHRTLQLVLPLVGMTCSALALAERNLAAETGAKIRVSFTVAAVGDLIMPQPLYSDEPGFQKLTDQVRKADVGFANMEMSLVDFRSFHGAVTGVMAPLETGEAIKAMGFRLVNHANNHAFDGGVAGMFSTDEALDRLGITHAGSGQNLQEARAAQFLETPKGRVGLVGMFAVDDISNYGPSYVRTLATMRNGDIGGAPGVDPLNLTSYHIVKPEQLQSLRNIVAGVPGSPSDSGAAGPQRVRFYDEWFQAGEELGGLHYEMNANDERDILQSIRNGKVYADFMMATVHTHQSSSTTALNAGLRFGIKEGIDHVAPDFLIRLAHDCVDAGADMFVAHGVHVLRGIEIYHGKPIFYGLSNFVFQFGLQFGEGYDILGNEKALSGLEHPDVQQTVLTTSRFEDGRLAEVRLYPVDLGGPRRPISRMGIPLAAAPDDAQRILKALQEYSVPFGTKIAIEDNVGVIRLAADARSPQP